MMTVLLWILAAFAALLLRRYLKWRFSPLNSIPGPIQNFSLRGWAMGVFSTIQNEPFMQPHQRWLKEAGPDTKMLHYTGILGKQFICVLDADGVKKILSDNATVARPVFAKGLPGLKKMLGDGLITLDGSDWHRHRKIIQPSFNNQVLKVALDTCIPDFMDQMIAAWKERPGSDIDISSHMSALTLDVVGKVVFSHDFNSMELFDEWSKNESKEVKLKDPLINGLYATLSPSVLRMLLMNLYINELEKFLVPQSYKAQLALDQAVKSVVANARLKHNDRGSTTKPKCLLELLFDAEDSEPGSRNKNLSHKELEDETKTFLVAGHETTSTLCSWAIYCLTQHPHLQKLVLEDIMEHAPKDGQITLKSIEKMTYFDAFVKEVLRLYPPVGMIVRRVGQSTNILGENIPKATRIMIPIHLLHRDPKYWTEPKSFKPERWLNGTKDPKFNRFAYLPFSAGLRNCIGQRFGMWEAKLILAPIIREFEMTISPTLDGVDLKLVSFISLKSVPPVLVCANPRS